MGSNKITCIHITRNDIRLLEGRIQSGQMLLSQAATIGGAGRFFNEDRLSALTEMVNAIVNAMALHSFTSKELHIVYDVNMDVNFFLDEKLNNNKNDRKGLNFSLGKKKDEVKTDSSSNDSQTRNRTAVISHKKQWGRFVTEFEKGELYTTSVIERDLVGFLVTEFHEHGYQVASIEAPETALLYLRKMVPYTYDSLHKLIVYANNTSAGMLYQFTKDMPAGNKPFHFDDIPAPRFSDQTIGIIKEEIRKSKLHRPNIFLVGDVFADQELYCEICNGLKDEGLTPIDLYGIWEDPDIAYNAIEVFTPEEVDFNICGQYGLCICMLARTLEKKPENMIEGVRAPSLSIKSRRVAAEVASVAAVAFLIYNLSFTGIGLYQNLAARSAIERSSQTTEAQLANAKMDRDASKAESEVIKTIDSRYNDIFRFVYQQVNSNLNIASVDTADMIPTSSSSGSNYSSDTNTDSSTGTADTSDTSSNDTTDVTATDGNNSADNTSSDVAANTSQNATVVNNEDTGEYQFKTIVIRGYSRTTEGPMNLYNALTKAGMGEVKIVGVEQVPLPSKETLFAFELTVGAEGV